MLVAAQLYKEELHQKLRATWYDIKYQYFWQGSCNDIEFPPENYWKKQFAFLDKDGQVTGYFSYNYCAETRSLNNFGLISFIDYNPRFIQAVIEHLENVLSQGYINRIEFFAYEDGPANQGYQKLVKRFGGRQVGKLTKCSRLLDGKLHNTVFYEIFRWQWLQTRAERHFLEDVEKIESWDSEQRAPEGIV